MEQTPDTTEKTEENMPEIDTFWIVANIFALISLIEDKFGPQAVEHVVATATLIEEAMRKETAGQE